MTAARTGDAGAVKLLLDRGADVSGREHEYGETALMWAAAENHADAVTLLGAEVRHGVTSAINSRPIIRTRSRR